MHVCAFLQCLSVSAYQREQTGLVFVLVIYHSSAVGQSTGTSQQAPADKTTHYLTGVIFVIY